MSPKHRIALQLIDDERSAYALLHRASDPETNRAGALVCCCVRSGKERLLRLAGIVAGEPVRIESAEMVGALESLPVA